MEDFMLSGFIGSLIGVSITVILFVIKEVLENIACTNAIKAEIKCLSIMCEENFDEMILNDSLYLNLYYPLDTDYFTVFNNNSSKIGKIFFRKERELIIAIYITAKYFVDCLKTNNSCLDKFEKIEEKYGALGKNSKEYEEEIAFARDNLIHSKEKNILPTYKKLKGLLAYMRY